MSQPGGEGDASDESKPGGDARPHPLRRWLGRFVPPAVPLSRYARDLTQDGVERLLGRRDPLIPPTRWMYDGSNDRESYLKDGAEFFDYFLRHCDLKPDEHVLDAGCGIGRKAVRLADFLGDAGRYEGFDIVELGIRWCQRQVTRRRPNFHFHHAPVFNAVYNPSGSIAASEYRFPFPEASFDFAFSTSLFTHMLPADVEHYLSEMARVLRPGGRCLNTFYLWNDESRALWEAGRSQVDFRYEMGVWRTANREHPEGAIAYEEDFIRAAHERVGLRIRPQRLDGQWCGRDRFESFQDLVVADRVVEERAGMDAPLRERRGC